ncbi:hypothetical protein MJD09_20455, partial [bacterium]|nr:hypothetical protein [bacterium]
VKMDSGSLPNIIQKFFEKSKLLTSDHCDGQTQPLFGQFDLLALPQLLLNEFFDRFVALQTKNGDRSHRAFLGEPPKS